jgi:ParB-like chromosome segregation protein Spo0J
MSPIALASSNLKVVLLPIDELKPHEMASPLYLELLRQEILRDGVLKYPIVADEKSHVILDGMHRWLALKSLGYKLVPVVLVDAFQNPKIRVGRRRIHRYIDDGEGLSVAEVISAGLQGRLMKPRSTRHFFSFLKPQQINYPLQLLDKGVPQDVSKYLAKMSKEENAMAIEEWLKEFSEELEFLSKRREEVEKEMEEFLNRIKDLKFSLIHQSSFM